MSRIAPGEIEIRASRAGDVLQLRVKDNGPGLHGREASSGRIKEGLGLANTRARLQQMYGAAHRFEMADVAEGGLQVTIDIPFEAEEIDWIEAEGKYVRLHVGKESYLLREAIGSMEGQLDPKKLRELQPWFHNEYRVILKDGTELMLSRSCRKRLGELLGSAL